MSGAWAFGNTVFPLTADTENELIKDADPALYWAGEMMAAILREDIGERLRTQAALVDLTINDAVKQLILVDPLPTLHNDQFKFPLLSLYRKTETYAEASAIEQGLTSEWEFAYLLPPLTPKGQRSLSPILYAALQSLARVVKRGWDPRYEEGANIWERGGITKARVVRAQYGGYEAVAENGDSPFYRAVTGTIQVMSREDSNNETVLETYELLSGFHAHVDKKDPNDSAVYQDLAQFRVGPRIASISPDTGTHDGGTPVIISGGGFNPDGPPPTVTIAGTECTSVVVLDQLTLSAVTGAHVIAGASLISDVVVTNPDGYYDKLSAGFTYTNP